MNDKTFSTRKARGWEVEEKKRLLTVTAMPQALTFSSASRAYLEDCKARIAPDTFKEKLRHLRDINTNRIGVHFADLLEPTQVIRLWDAELTGPKPRLCRADINALYKKRGECSTLCADKKGFSFHARNRALIADFGCWGRAG